VAEEGKGDYREVEGREDMNEHAGRESVDDVLNAYVASSAGPSYEALTEWIQRYPHFERELTEFTVGWSLSETLPPIKETEEVDQETLVLRGMSVVQGILNKEDWQPTDKHTPFAGLLKEGKHRGLSIDRLAEVTRLSAVLVRKLDRRLIVFASIPTEAIAVLARAVARGKEEVARYLRGQPMLPNGASYKAEEAPKLSESEDFFEAVRTDKTLPEEWRRHWLSLESSED
jgi:hypothetical protein